MTPLIFCIIILYETESSVKKDFIFYTLLIYKILITSSSTGIDGIAPARETAIAAARAAILKASSTVCPLITDAR